MLSSATQRAVICRSGNRKWIQSLTLEPAQDRSGSYHICPHPPPALCLEPLSHLCRDPNTTRAAEPGWGWPRIRVYSAIFFPLSELSPPAPPNPAKGSEDCPPPLPSSATALTHPRPAGLPVSLMGNDCSWTSQLCSSAPYNQSSQPREWIPSGLTDHQAYQANLCQFPKFHVQEKGLFKKVLRVGSLIGQAS